MYIKTIDVDGFNLMSIESCIQKLSKQKTYETKLWGTRGNRLFMTAKGERENLIYNKIQDYVFDLFVMYVSAYLPLTQFPDSDGSLRVVRKDFLYENLILPNLKKENVDYCILSNHQRFIDSFLQAKIGCLNGTPQNTAIKQIWKCATQPKLKLRFNNL